MPNAIRRKRISQLAFELEATEGTAETLVAADVLALAEDIEFAYDVEQNEHRPQMGFMGRDQNTPGMETFSGSFRHPITAGVDATTAPPCDDPLQACGLEQLVVNTVVLAGAPTGTFRAGERFTDDATGLKIAIFLRISGTTVTYAKISGSDFGNGEAITGSISGATATTHASAANVTRVGTGYRPVTAQASQKSGTTAALEEGVRKLGTGVRGNVEVMADGAGRVLMGTFNFQGAGALPADVALFSGISKPAVKRLSLKAATVTADGDALCVANFKLTTGNGLQYRDCASETGGVLSAVIEDRDPTVEIDPEATTRATIDYFAKFQAGDVFEFFALFGNATDGEVIVAAAQAQYAALGDGDRNGRRVHQATLNLVYERGDDEYVIACIA